MRAIITYHSIDDSGSPISVSPAVFEHHLRWFAGRQVPVVTLGELVSRPSGPPAIALTFDDALQSVAEWAVPRLAEHGLPATVFVPTGHVGGDNRWRGLASLRIPVFPVMSWSTLAAIAEQGMDIGGHSRSHPMLQECSLPELETEVAGCAEDIRRELGVTPRRFAYPFGASDATVRRLVAQRFEYGVTTALRSLGRAEDSHLLPRIDAWYLRDVRWFERWGSTALRSFLGLRRMGRAVRATFQ